MSFCIFLSFFLFQLLLNLARSIFEEQTSLERLVSKIMKEAQELIKCERSFVYLRDVPLYEAVRRTFLYNHMSSFIYLCTFLTFKSSSIFIRVKLKRS